MKPPSHLYLLSLLLLVLDASVAGLCTAKSAAPSQAVSQENRPVSLATQTSVAEALRTFQTYYLKIDTIFLERSVIEQALDKRPELHAWGLMRTDNPSIADVIIEFNLPALTWQWNFLMTHRSTGLLLGRGMIRALEEYEASELLVQSIVTVIQPHRKAPDLRSASALSLPGALAEARTWAVKGVGGALQGQSVNLIINRDSVRVSGPAVIPFDIPVRNILYAYHQEIGDALRAKILSEWEKGWDTACALTQAAQESDGCLAMFGFPLYLLGEVVLLSGEPGPTHSVVLRLQEGSSAYDMAFLASASDWPLILADLQAVIPGEKKQPIREAKELKKEFEAAKENAVQILLQVPVDVGRWPALEPGDYKLVINDRGDGRADIFFYKLPAVDFTKPRAVAAALVARLSPPMPDSKVTFLEKGSFRFFDEVRVGGYLLRFD